MTLPEWTPSELLCVDDAELARLAKMWRAEALRGNRDANGIAHALEVEGRRRVRADQAQQHALVLKRQPKPWWMFWAGSERTRSQTFSSLPHSS